jgi:hypothetical protein
VKRSVLGDRPSTVAIALATMTDERLAFHLEGISANVAHCNRLDRALLLREAAARLTGAVRQVTRDR